MLRSRTEPQTAPDATVVAPRTRLTPLVRITGLALAVRAGLWVVGTWALVHRRKRPTPGMWNRWDASHFLKIVAHGYLRGVPEIVYPPAYPYLVKGVLLAVRDPIAASLLVSFVASVAAGWLLYRLTELAAPADEAWRAVVLLFLFPTGYFLAAPYAEGLFLVGVLGAIYAARTDRWPLAALAGAVATATRLPGIVLVPVLCLEAWQATEHRVRKFAWACASALGTVAFLVLNRAVDGNAFTFMHVEQKVWHQRVVAPWSPLVEAVHYLPFHHDTISLLQYGSRIAGALFAVAVLAWGWRRLRLGDRVFAIGTLVVCLSASRLISLPRYLLPIYPLAIVLAYRSSDRRVYALLIAGGIAAQVLLFARFVNAQWAF